MEQPTEKIKPKFDDGGSMYPSPVARSEGGGLMMSGEYFSDGQGITYRQWLVGLALQGFLSSADVPTWGDNDYAHACVKFADAVIKAEKERRA